MDVLHIIEIFAFVTGILYIVLEIGQKNAMWIIGILTGIACAWSFAVQTLWASMGLNIYYVFMSVWGLWQWRRDSRLLAEKTGRAEDAAAAIRLRRPSRRVLFISAILTVVGSAGLIALLHLLGDRESAMDAIVAVLSAVGTWWLAKSYPQQWLVWIVADLLSTILCLAVGMYWMALLYLAYTASAVYGWFHWTRQGVYIE